MSSLQLLKLAYRSSFGPDTKMKLFRILPIVALLFFTPAESFESTKTLFFRRKFSVTPCQSCRSSRDCGYRYKCWGWPSKCVPGDKYDDMLKCGFLAECQRCRSSLQCATKKCWGGKCVSSTDMKKCFQPPTVQPPTGCPSCRSSRDCGFGGKCWGWPSKCIPGDRYEDMLKCGFLAECQQCRFSLQCATKKCWGGKCVSSTDVRKCFRPPTVPPPPVCPKCRNSKDCPDGKKCWGSPRKCIPGDKYEDMLKCGFLAECEPCKKNAQCATKKCRNEKCVFKSNRKKCFAKPEPPTIPPPTGCPSCRSSRDCGIGGKCWGWPRKCVSGDKYEDMLKCGFLAECQPCRVSLQCATKKCWGGKCVSKTDIKKCFH